MLANFFYSLVAGAILIFPNRRSAELEMRPLVGSAHQVQDSRGNSIERAKVGPGELYFFSSRQIS